MENKKPETEQTKDESKVKGGLARAESLTTAEKSAIAKKGAEARWGEAITHGGVLKLAGFEVPCYVTENEIRVLSGRGMQDALKLVDDTVSSTDKAGSRLGRLFGYKSLQPLIEQAKSTGRFDPIKLNYKGKVLHGYQADALSEICKMMLEARAEGLLKTKRQLEIAKRCEVLLRAFAKVGLTALVDEATGYQYTRARNAMEAVFEAFIQKELRKWVKTFPDEFYYHICRLKGWHYDEDNKNKRGISWARLTNHLIYSRLAPGVLQELKRLTPRNSKGKHKNRLFQRLTEDIGHPRLRELLASEITLMRIFDEGQWDTFEEKLNIAIPVYKALPLFDQYEKESTDESRLMH